MSAPEPPTTSSTPEPQGPEEVNAQEAPAVANANGGSDGKRLFIGNLAYSATEDEVRNFLAPAGGNLESLELPVRFNRPSGFAFAVYSTHEQAQTAVDKLSKQLLNDREINVAFANPPPAKRERRPRKPRANTEATDGENATTVATTLPTTEGATTDTAVEGGEKPQRKKAPRKKRPARRLPADQDEAAPEEPATTDAEPVERKPNNRNKNRRNKPRNVSNAAENEVKPEDARIDETAVESNAEQKENQERKPRERKPRAPRTTASGEPSSTLLFVANLPYSVDDAQLSELFTGLNIGVKSAKVITGSAYRRKGVEQPQPSRRSKGFGFVEVSDPAQQKEAVEKLAGHKLGEREITVKVANERQQVEQPPAEEQVAAEVGVEGGSTEAW